MKILFVISLFSLIYVPAFSQAVPVELNQLVEGRWELIRDGEPYIIKGAGGDGSKQLLAKSGGNTLRTWGIGEETLALLNEAQELGLTVILGHWLGHERHGFDYTNKEMVAEQYDRVKRDVLKYKDHPALLMWALGNEMEGYESGDNPNIWNHIQELAEMVKELDPHHPIMSVTAEIGGGRVQAIHSIAKDIDIHGINSYGGLPSLVERYKQSGGTKPIIITEFGPPGTWEVGTTSYGAPPELTSTEKADIYKNAYQSGCLDYSELCLGGFAFTWGSKMEATATWFGMFLPTGEKLAAVDAMTEIWGGNPPENLSPVIKKFGILGSDVVNSGEEINIELTVSDPDGDDLEVQWIVRGEVGEYFTGGDVQSIPFELEGIIQSSSNTRATLIAPGGGIYRLYVKIFDGNGAAAVANVPFKVVGKSKPAHLKLPIAVYADNAEQPWYPSGWMGNSEKLTMNLESHESPYSGENSIEFTYSAFDNWVGVVWQNPINDWGDKQGGYNLTGAKKLTFWARGKNGGEKVTFGMGIINKDKEFFDTAFAELKDVKLSTKWKKYAIDLNGKDLTRVKTPFRWSLVSSGLPVTFYLDDIQFE